MKLWELETIKVQHKDGYMVINKKNFDKEEHVEYKNKPLDKIVVDNKNKKKEQK